MITILPSRAIVALCLGLGLPGVASAAPTLSLDLIGRYTTGLVDIEQGESSGETVALRGDRMYVTNALDVSLDIVDVSDPAHPQLIKRVDLSPWGAAVNSVDVSSRNLVAVALASARKTDPGTVVFLTPGGQVKRTVTVGSLPDMVVFTHDGKRLLVANEGEPDCYGAGCTDPKGSISIIDVYPMVGELPVHTVRFDGVFVPAEVRIFGPGASIAQDLEPEYIAISDDDTTAWVTLQENNAVARIDLQQLAVTGVHALGYKNHGIVGNGLDASDKDGAIHIQPWDGVFGMYQPDAIAQFNVNGETYLITANEGDARDYDGFAEEERARDLAETYPSLAGIYGVDDKKLLGRLTVTSSPSQNDFTHLYAFGARSASIWRAADMTQVWDSGEQMEQTLAALLPDAFNANNDENDAESRSDNKGPEPEGVATGNINGRNYAFVGLERVGGVMVYDVTNPYAPVFQDYLVTRDFSSDDIGPDSGPEIIRFITANHSPTGQPLLLIANEITGTIEIVDLVINP